MSRSRNRTEEEWNLHKIFSVALGTENDVYTELTLPATPYVMLDALEKLRLEQVEKPNWELTRCFVTGELARRLDPEGSLFELNALAEQLSTLNERELAVVEGLTKIEGTAVIPMDRFIDLAYSADRCHFLDGVLDDTQLGRFCAENGFVPQVDDLPDETFELLDFAKIGRQFRLEQRGVFTNHGYVQRHDELREIHKYLDFRLKNPDYTILAETSSGCEIKLPYPPNDPMGTEVVRCVDCAAPSLIGLTVGMESMDLLARRLAGMEPQELTAYKALLEAVDCKDLSDAGLLADSLDNYIFRPSFNSPEEVAEEELGVILCEESIPQLIPYVDLRGYGQSLIEQRGSVLTPYGLLEREDGQPIHNMNDQPEQGGMEMRF